MFSCLLFFVLYRSHRQLPKMSQRQIFPGKVNVCFRKGPSGFLLQKPSDEADKIKKNPSLQDKSLALSEDVVHKTAKEEVFNRGGDYTDRTEILGEYTLQFGKYKGKTFRWALENDVGYTVYLFKDVQKEREAGVFVAEGHKKTSMVTFLDYAHSFEEIRALLKYEAERASAPPPALSPDDNIVGYGTRAKDTWKEIWDSRADGYAAFVMGQTCKTGSRMHKLQQYLLQQKAKAPTLPATPLPQSTGMSVLNNPYIIKTFILM